VRPSFVALAPSNPLVFVMIVPGSAVAGVMLERRRIGSVRNVRPVGRQDSGAEAE
jgi:hypothetical protein